MLKEYKTLFPYMKPHWKRYVIGLSCLVFIDAAQLLLPQFLRKAIDSIIADDPISIIVAIAVAMVLTSLCIAVVRFLWRFFIHGAARRVETAIRDRLFAHLMVLPMSFFNSHPVGDIMAKATNDMQAIRQASGMALVAFTDGLFMSVAILSIMFIQNPETTLYTMIPLPFLTLLIIFFGKSVGKRFKKVQDSYSGVSTVVQETLQGIRVVKSFVKEDEFDKRFNTAITDYKTASMSLVKVFGLFHPLISFLAGLTSVILIITGGSAVIENKMTAGSLAAMLSYLEMLIWPMLGAGFTVNMLQRGAVSLKRVNDVFNTSPEPKYRSDVASTTDKKITEVNLQFKDLSITYDGALEPALKDVSFSLSNGQTLGILGKIGSGKTTLVKAIVRLIEAPSGTVLLNDIDVGAYPLDELRASTGFVPQDSFLFSDSIKNNILFSAPDLSEKRFAEIISISAIDNDIDFFADGWDTIVGEKGLTLSGGQKQRLAIARAIAKDPKLLVLDDALSAVDTETEEAIINALMKDRKSKTTIFISNRVSTLQNADIVAVFDAGKLIQLGSPDELARAKGFYSEIAALQALRADK